MVVHRNINVKKISYIFPDVELDVEFGRGIWTRNWCDLLRLTSNTVLHTTSLFKGFF